jgi:hypothetical protein
MKRKIIASICMLFFATSAPAHPQVVIVRW